MTATTNDGSDRPPRLLAALNLVTVWDLPDWSEGPQGDPGDVLDAVAAAGYEGVQGYSSEGCAERGLLAFGMGRVDAPGDAATNAERWARKGFAAGTVHVGSGLEDDDTAIRLLEEIVQASADHGLPVYVETHRATITQDLYRTVRLVERVPEVRFNADLSHWYTGLEMTYGDFDARVEFAAPVLERVRFVHGRISEPGCIQVDVGDGSADGRPHVGHFETMWRRSFEGFMAHAGPGDYLTFAPELLPSSLGYARTVATPDGARTEEVDRWTQAGVLVDIARRCWPENRAN